MLPDDLLYHLEYDVWVRRAPGDPGTALLGLTAVLAAFAGRFVSFAFRPPEARVSAGRSVGTVESVRFTGAVRLPVDGTIVERNPALPERPRLMNDDPYHDGWVVRFRPDDLAALDRSLVTSTFAEPHVRERIRREGIRCYAALPDLELYEIGAECSAILARVDDELARRPPNDVLLLVTDDPTSPIELVRWSDRTGHTVLEHRRDAGLHHFLLRKEAHPVPRRRGA